MNGPVIRTEGLTHYYRDKCVLRELSLHVPRGCVMGLLGRNGSGKTTLIRLLLGLMAPTRGSCEVLGQPSLSLTPAMRGRIGYLSEGHPVVPWMTLKQCAQYQRAGHAQWSDQLYEAVLDHFNLGLRQRAKHLSRGQCAGLALALTLAPQPELLILDDPALGLDPVARRTLLEAMVHFTREQGRTILFSSHLLDDVERVADRIAILDRGILKVCCATEDFREAVSCVVVHCSRKLDDTTTLPGLLNLTQEGDAYIITLVHFNAETKAKLARLGCDIIEHRPMNLEDAIIGYMGERGRKRFFLSNLDQPRTSFTGSMS
ncbi:MAG: ABC transporter ATP-binding protein [Phycisphaeraceae bacterium]|nr:ABC transporter ATP-binding protein [Phycisphaeraceae bacterium]